MLFVVCANAAGRRGRRPLQSHAAVKGAGQIIDSMITLAGAMHKKSFFAESKYTLAYLGIDNMPKEELLAYLNEGVYNR